MNAYQEALAAARMIKEYAPIIEEGPLKTQALKVVEMFLRNHAIAHGEKPT